MLMKGTESLKKNKVSNVFNISRVIAIVSVIAAHTTFNINNPVLYNLIKRFSSIGVIVFIIISGYYFNPKRYLTITKFLKIKITTIILPWIAMGTLVFLESKIVMGLTVDFFSWLKFMIGHNSYLYYLTILMICYLIYFYPVKHDKIKIICTISFVITCISQQLTAWGIIDISRIRLTNYLNILNWVGYFCIGIFMKKIDVYTLLSILKKRIILFIITWGALFVVAYYYDVKTGYFSLFAIPLQMLGAIVVFGICSFDVFDCRITRYISKVSFCIYLTHMAIVPVVYKFLGNVFIIKLFVPLITLLFMAVIFFIGEILSHKLKISNFYYRILGIRKERRN